MGKSVLVPVANGTEDLEAVAIIDILRRADAKVTVASITGSRQVTFSRGMAITADALLENCVTREYDLVVLDEINIAISAKLIEVDEIVRLIEEKPPNVELILTGRDADPRLVKIADLVSEILMIKHPFTEGVKARKGIDY